METQELLMKFCEKLLAKRRELVDGRMLPPIFNRIEYCTFIPKNELQNLNQFNEGANGFCFECEYNNNKFVVKFLRTYDESEILHEIAALCNAFCMEEKYIVKPFMLNDAHVLVYDEIDNCIQVGIAMEYIKGVNLKDIADLKLSVDVRLNIFCNIVDTLYFLHLHELRHQDLHGGNILICNEKPVIIDLGSMAPYPVNTNANDVQCIWTELIGLFDDEELNSLPELIRNWWKSAYNSRFSELPNDLHYVCSQLRNMSLGHPTLVCVGPYSSYVRTHIHNGIHHFSFEKKL